MAAPQVIGIVTGTLLGLMYPIKKSDTFTNADVKRPPVLKRDSTRASIIERYLSKSPLEHASELFSRAESEQDELMRSRMNVAALTKIIRSRETSKGEKLEAWKGIYQLDPMAAKALNPSLYKQFGGI